MGDATYILTAIADGDPKAAEQLLPFVCDELRRLGAQRLADEAPGQASARKRFSREARASAQVRHENVVQVNAVEEKPLPYLVMEHIRTFPARLCSSASIASDHWSCWIC